jgi:hypothetical protein
MAGEEYTTTKNALGAVLFMTSSMNTLDVYSTLNSSPWTAESFGADDRRSAALREYVTHAVIYSLAYAGASAWIVRGKLGWWIILASVITNAYLVWLYTRASRRGREAGNEDWANS